jgi:hypothetical protein
MQIVNMMISRSDIIAWPTGLQLPVDKQTAIIHMNRVPGTDAQSKGVADSVLACWVGNRGLN